MKSPPKALEERELAERILPYSRIIGQEQVKLALELSFIAPPIGGVLLSGHRGTGKSTATRAFARMMYSKLPVTLPINATEDRVVGGWSINELLRGDPVWQDGLLQEANGSMLYVDEVNLLDDHIINLILDVTSTGILEIQREGRRERKQVFFTLVGTMNPEEGGLRPQLLDRFGLMVNVVAETNPELRGMILQTVLDYDRAIAALERGEQDEFLVEGRRLDEGLRVELERARDRLRRVSVPEPIVQSCVDLAKAFEVEGHRGDYVLLMAARALAARDGDLRVTREYLRVCAPLALQHRRPGVLRSGQVEWTEPDDQKVMEYLDNG